MSKTATKHLLSGDEAVALAAYHAGIQLGTGYPGTPSTEILETFSEMGGKSQWAPNEKVALEVGLGVAFGGARALVTMKHVGLNVAADPLFTAAYTDIKGALIIISADDPGMASSQNEQDNRRYAVAAGIPLFEPADSQEAYDFLFQAIEVSERWSIPVLFRMTTRVCHSKTIVNAHMPPLKPADVHFERNIRERVMIPAYARPAHRKLRKKLMEIAEWNETSSLNQVYGNGSSLGMITSGVVFNHAMEAEPDAAILKLGMTYPLPAAKIRNFVQKVERCYVVEEGDPYLYESLKAFDLPVKKNAETFRFGELNVNRVRKILAQDETPEVAVKPGKPPQLCPGCPHRTVFTVLNELGCIVAGDIGCYTLGVLSPFEAMDTCVCMGASIGVGLGLRHVLPRDQARRVVSVIGDSTFVHSGITGLVEMVYNAPDTGHVVMILDNETTAMTGLQEHPGTGRSLDHKATNRVDFEALIRAIGIDKVHVIDPQPSNLDNVKQLVQESLQKEELTVIITRRPCILAFGKIREYEKMNQAAAACDCSACEF
jgi:indolepyruvate ferredoxin oxidoreductase alpha subunit